ncbi:MAG: thioredoxin family protein [Planctomycetes bacterium]|nr:thioredoxin family protein [Planctomycetota bacterium]
MRKKIHFHILGKKGSDAYALRGRLDEALRGFPNVQPTIIEVDDDTEIMTFGVSLLPALAIDGTARIIGRVPEVAEIAFFLSEICSHDGR